MFRVRAAMVGLDGSGKSAIVSALQGHQVIEGSTSPTQGCHKCVLYRHDNGAWGPQLQAQHCRFSLELLDLGGSDAMRQFWRPICRRVDALVTVVDVTEQDPKRWGTLAEELQNLRTDAEQGGSGVLPVLVLLNRKGRPLQSCAPAMQDLIRLGVKGQFGVHAIAINSSMDMPALGAGLAWLWSVLGPGVKEPPNPNDPMPGPTSSGPATQTQTRRDDALEMTLDHNVKNHATLSKKLGKSRSEPSETFRGEQVSHKQGSTEFVVDEHGTEFSRILSILHIMTIPT